jgi:cell pole-organizing protein PopZ
MTASNASSSRAAEQRAHEPSMEEILASIRRIIADDQPLPLTPRTTAAPETPAPARYVEPAPAAVEPVARPSAPQGLAAEFRSSMSAFEAPRPVEPPRVAELQPEPPRMIAEPPRAIEPPAAFEPVAAAPEEDHEPPLVSAATDASVATAFQALAATRLMPTGEALNEIVRDMLRPMLKGWLDDNLPVLVERLVRAEIERVARGGR